MNNIGHIIKRIRKEKGLTQEELAKLLGYADKSMISHIEKGDSDIAIEKVELLIKKLEVEPNELFGEKHINHQSAPSHIGDFKRYIGIPTTMKYGYYYQKMVKLPFSEEPERMVRVWLPEDYEFNNPDKRYKVIYFSDGQNLVDRYLSAYGEWELDKTIHKLMNEGLSGVILVGLDCPKEPLERTKELCPPYSPRQEVFKREGGHFRPYANMYADYIVNELKPLIDKIFFTLGDRDNTGIGGSSMGGIMSFFAYIYRPDAFGFSLSFSPAFFFYKKNDWLEILDKYDINPNKNGKLFLYCGGKDFESIFLKPTLNTYEYLEKRGFDNSQLALIVDTNEIHHEGAWAKYAPDALRYWLK